MTQTPARSVNSTQQGIHENLHAVVMRYQQSAYRKPIADHTRQAFQQVAEIIAAQPKPIVLDSGCGTALSTRQLAIKHPDCWVIGIDRSEVRLGKEHGEQMAENGLTVRADLVDFWLLAAQAGWNLSHHYLLFPNPYPKGIHLKRRWHAHPVFPSLLVLGGQLELRTNWRIYAEEFAFALQLYGYQQAQAEVYQPELASCLSLFEKKYLQAGQALYRCSVSINADSSDPPSVDANR